MRVGDSAALMSQMRPDAAADRVVVSPCVYITAAHTRQKRPANAHTQFSQQLQELKRLCFATKPAAVCSGIEAQRRLIKFIMY